MNIVLKRTSPFLFLICILIIPLGCNKPGASHSNSTEERENTVESMSKEAQYGLGQVALDFEHAGSQWRNGKPELTER